MDGRKLTAEEKERLRQERLERQRLEALERQRRTQQLTEAAYWRGYHDAMRDVARQEWRKRGIEEKVQDWFLLGYAMKEQHPSLTIPFHNREWAVETLQYRLLDVDGRGKYRFESGYPATAFYCDTPGDYPFIIVEGAIKAMVLWWRMVVERDRRYNVVAVPSKTPGRVVVERLAEEIGDSRVYLMLDPDASGEEQMRIGSGFTDCRYVAMPFKVDDAINEGYDPLSIERLFIKSATVEPL